ncbi:hypothetical protein [Pseudomonas sp. UMAB-08]|uniref:hypothetical protein n=1 Tax=Pseudomonas sp. UMAB-08 TaxID=1365375 RepID=UPI001C585124|nr:hypothetical protein [Pseudomonas sp. UMAB-08]
MQPRDFYVKQEAEEGRQVNLSNADGTPSGHWLVVRSVLSQQYEKAFSAIRAQALSQVVELSKAGGKDQALRMDTQDAVDRIVPSLNPEPDREEFHCEWALWADRERIRAKLSQLMTANPAPVAVALPERKRADYYDESQDVKSYFEELGWNACLDEVTRLNTK